MQIHFFRYHEFEKFLILYLFFFQEVNEPRYGPDEKSLEILQAYDKVVPRTKHRKLFTNPDDEEEGLIQEPPPPPPLPSADKGQVKGPMA